MKKPAVIIIVSGLSTKYNYNMPVLCKNNEIRDLKNIAHENVAMCYFFQNVRLCKTLTGSFSLNLSMKAIYSTELSLYVGSPAIRALN